MARPKSPNSAADKLRNNADKRENPNIVTTPLAQSGFNDVVAMIEAARRRAYQAVNTELVGLYWQIGEHISRKIATAEWGDKVVDQLAQYLAKSQPGLKGFTRPNLFRMRQFYELYRDNEIVSPLLRQLPWSHISITTAQ